MSRPFQAFDSFDPSARPLAGGSPVSADVSDCPRAPIDLVPGSITCVAFEAALESYLVGAALRPGKVRVGASPFPLLLVACPGLEDAIRWFLRRYLRRMGIDWIAEILSDLYAWVLGIDGVRGGRRGARILAADAAKLLRARPGRTVRSALRSRGILKIRELAARYFERALHRRDPSIDVESAAVAGDIFAEIDRRLDAESVPLET